MAHVPKIWVTDPQSKESAPLSASPAQSPVKQHSTELGDAETATPANARSAKDARPTTGGRTSPSKLLRSLSNSRLTQSIGSYGQDAESKPMQDSQAIDPLSRHILKRTSTSHDFLAQRPRSPDVASATADRSSEVSVPERLGASLQPSRSDAGATAHKDRKKGVSFLSRIIGNKKKDTAENVSDAGSEQSDPRPEGTDAPIFSQPVDNIEYNPRHPQPPSYIKVRAKHKKERDFDRLFLAQELCGTKKKGCQPTNGNTSTRKRSATNEQNTIWAMEFSKDGRYLAAAGHDRVVRVWAVISSAEERHTHEKDEAASSSASHSQALHLNAPVFRSEPLHQYEGHDSTILDLSWSKNNFLLSSSMDKTVRLWHVSRSECLCVFKHNDFVPSITFHPKDDRFFLAGSLDSKLRLWSIPDKSVAYWAQLPEMITAVAFTPDGKSCMAGCFSGLCMFYETEGMKYQTQIHVRSTHGKNAKGSKITGIQATYWPPGNTSGDVKLLISSNDSRIRLYNFRDKSLDIKFKGNENNYSQIRATLSDDARYVACGSEDHKAYIWSLGPAEGEKRDKRPMEMFEAHNTVTTAVTFAPTKTRQLLGKSEDPIYDLCNPPPVMLVSRAERPASWASSKAPTESGSVLITPADTEAKFRRPEESPAYIARSTHTSGNIIVTADLTGRIKVFRQDCAFSKRRTDNWETSSVFSKRMPGRTSSVQTKASNRSLRSTKEYSSSHAPSDRILSWRQGIASTGNVANGSGRSSTTNRSVSPSKSLGRTSVRSSISRLNPNTASVPDLPQPHASTSNLSQQDSLKAPTQPHPSAPELQTPRAGHDISASSTAPADNPLMLEGDQSYMFWQKERWKATVDRAKHNMAPAGQEDDRGTGASGGRLEAPGIKRRTSSVSTLSIDRSEGGTSEDGPKA
ncbi:hypothetical protein LTR28_004220 [Elasticomyces elasticus]|nr:hypothetical protein LTR28_004220 [Elasticomyces elasticus]